VRRHPELSAIQTIRAIQEAELQYQSTYPDIGYTCSHSALMGDPKSGPPTPEAAQILRSSIYDANGISNGYIFRITGCTKNSMNRATSYLITAVPQTPGETGNRGFCSDQSGRLKTDPTGGTHCIQDIF
jgi:type IV pilus assembly protein PilA